MKRSVVRLWQPVVLIVLVAALAGLVVKHQAVQDWFKLRGYSAPAAVAQLAIDDTMTDKARHLFYVNRPRIATGSSFTNHCPTGGEKTVVLGCYIGNDSGIYLYDVTDTRLHGVEQVTAAHEALHAAYRRLSNADRTRIDTMLTDYYEHGLTDQRIKDVIASYKQSEPDDVVNEMHSVFGTEVASLPAALENYYKQYFTDRSKITNYTATYQAEFTNRQTQIAQYDTQLKSLKQQIDTNETDLQQQNASLTSRGQQLQAERNGDTTAYNRNVSSYNAQVDAYNALIEATKTLINQYNDIVSQRNAVALEEQQLTQAISAAHLTTK
jgi:hypothetical protein